MSKFNLLFLFFLILLVPSVLSTIQEDVELKDTQLISLHFDNTGNMSEDNTSKTQVVSATLPVVDNTDYLTGGGSADFSTATDTLIEYSSPDFPTAKNWTILYCYDLVWSGQQYQYPYAFEDDADSGDILHVLDTSFDRTEFYYRGESITLTGGAGYTDWNCQFIVANRTDAFLDVKVYNNKTVIAEAIDATPANAPFDSNLWVGTSERQTGSDFRLDGGEEEFMMWNFSFTSGHVEYVVDEIMANGNHIPFGGVPLDTTPPVISEHTDVSGGGTNKTDDTTPTHNLTTDENADCDNSIDNSTWVACGTTGALGHICTSAVEFNIGEDKGAFVKCADAIPNTAYSVIRYNITDVIVPIANITIPLNNTFYVNDFNNTIKFNISSTDNHNSIFNLELRINDTSYFSDASYINDTYMLPNISLDVGTYFVNLTATDNQSNIGIVSLNLTVINDTVVPVVTIDEIDDGLLFINDVNNTVEFNVSCADNNKTYTAQIFINDTLYFENTTYLNGTFFGNTTNGTELGFWNWTVICTDPYSNVGRSERFFTLANDSEPPIVGINETGQLFIYEFNNTFDVGFNATDSLNNTFNLTAYFNGSMEYSNESYINGSTINFTISQGIGFYNFTAIGIDPYNNIGNSTFYFEVQNDTEAPVITVDLIEDDLFFIRDVNNTIEFNVSCDDNINETYLAQIFINDILFFENASYPNGTFFGNTTVHEDGYWNWTVLCDDGYNNIGRSERFFTVANDSLPRISELNINPVLNISRFDIYNITVNSTDDVKINYTNISILLNPIEDTTCWQYFVNGSCSNREPLLANMTNGTPPEFYEVVDAENLYPRIAFGLEDTFDDDTANFTNLSVDNFHIINVTNNLTINGTIAGQNVSNRFYLVFYTDELASSSWNMSFRDNISCTSHNWFTGNKPDLTVKKETLGCPDTEIHLVRNGTATTFIIQSDFRVSGDSSQSVDIYLFGNTTELTEFEGDWQNSNNGSLVVTVGLTDPPEHIHGNSEHHIITLSNLDTNYIDSDRVEVGACAIDNVSQVNCTNSTFLFQPIPNLPPIPNAIILPNVGDNTSGRFEIPGNTTNWTDPNGDIITYNWSLFQAEVRINDTLCYTNDTNCTFRKDPIPDGDYSLFLEGCDPSLLCSNISMDGNFTIDNSPPIVNITNLKERKFYVSGINTSDTQIDFNFTDNVFGVADCSGYIDNSIIYRNQTSPNGTNISFKTNLNVRMDQLLNITCVDNVSNQNSSTFSFDVGVIANMTLFFDGLNESRKYEFETTSNITFVISDDVNTSCIDIDDNINVSCNLGNWSYLFNITELIVDSILNGSKEFNMSDIINNVSIRIDNKTDLVKLTINLTGYENNNLFPSNVTIDINKRDGPHFIMPGKIRGSTVETNNFIYSNNYYDGRNITIALGEVIVININTTSISDLTNFTMEISGTELDNENEFIYEEHFNGTDGSVGTNSTLSYNVDAPIGVLDDFNINTSSSWSETGDCVIAWVTDNVMKLTCSNGVTGVMDYDYNGIGDMRNSSIITTLFDIKFDSSRSSDEYIINVRATDGTSSVTLAGFSSVPPEEYVNVTILKDKDDYTRWSVIENGTLIGGIKDISSLDFTKQIKIQYQVGAATLKIDEIDLSGVWLNRSDTNGTYNSAGNYTSNIIGETVTDVSRALLSCTTFNPDNTNIDYYLTNTCNSTLPTFESVQLDVIHTFTTVGGGICWRANLNSSVNISSPIIRKCTISVTKGSLENISVDFGNDGDADWTFEGVLNSTTSPKVVNGSMGDFVTYRTSNCINKKTCQYPVSVSSDSPGTIGIFKVNSTLEVEDISFNTSKIENHTIINMTVEFINSILEMRDIVLSFKGSKNFTIFGHSSGNTTTIPSTKNMSIQVKYSPFNISYPFGIFSFGITVTETPSKDGILNESSIIPFGQIILTNESRSQPIYNVTCDAYDDPIYIAEYLNESVHTNISIIIGPFMNITNTSVLSNETLQTVSFNQTCNESTIEQRLYHWVNITDLNVTGNVFFSPVFCFNSWCVDCVKTGLMDSNNTIDPNRKCLV